MQKYRSQSFGISATLGLQLANPYNWSVGYICVCCRGGIKMRQKVRWGAEASYAKVWDFVLWVVGLSSRVKQRRT